MELAHKEMKEHAAHIQELKSYMISKLEKNIEGIEFNGDMKGNSLYTVLNVMFPVTPDAEMLLMRLDIDGIAASGGSACSSGSSIGSHVIAALGKKVMDRPVIRFSFSKYNTKEEVDYVVEKLKEFFPVKVVA
jgi:cysteine desulfurase